MLALRTAIESDLPILLDIYNDVIVNTTAVYDYQPHTLEMRKQWFDTKRQQGIPVWLVEEEGKVLGFGTYGPFRAWAAYQYSVENSIYVEAEARGKGVGSMLLAAIIEEAGRQGMHTMLAGIDASNEVSIALHRKFGFEQVALFREVGWKFDRWLDLVFLQLMLKQR